MPQGNEDGEEESRTSQVETLVKELREAEKRSDDLLTRLKYAQADLENYRKRMDKEMKDAGESLARSLATKLLVVQDELDLAIGHSEGSEQTEELKEGLRMVQRNLRSALESVGVERIESVGMKFDPTMHEAVEKVQGSKSGDDIVAEEVRPGYTFRGQLLRPSMVKVELAKSAKQEARISE
jgi:molecular chaperone GrpE